MIKYFVLTFLTAITLFSISAQNTLSGRIRNAETGEYILGANVIIENQANGVSTNLYPSSHHGNGPKNFSNERIISRASLKCSLATSSL